MTALAAQQSKPVNYKALAWTIGLHLLLLLLFFWLQYTIPVVTAEVGNGLEVNLGSSEDGTGNDQPQSKNDPANYSSAVVFNTPPNKSTLPKDMLQSNSADAPEVNNPDKTKNISPETQGKDKPREPKPIPKYLLPAQTDNKGKGGNSAQQDVKGSSEGNTTGTGDRGVAGGTPGAPNYTGTPGSGGGTYHTLTGRDITPKRLEAEFKEGGKVVIHVTVDRDGNIVGKYVKSSSNKELTKLALEKLSKAKFSKSNNSEPQQFGDVTIVFKTR